MRRGATISETSDGPGILPQRSRDARDRLELRLETGLKASLRGELHIRLWPAPNRTVESREIAALPAADDALPCAQTPSVPMGARQLIVTDVEDRRNINE